ncbi:hypothetical protein [Sphingomonas turrisvirgatae]|uniref:Tail tubular protein A n=1 Tax=Sphingomonas turrisvirgatae TaxID=1888892 RepID=A0A1E3LZL2_9SPHN|nr:hypothetical protein [Sphingomonas turrisvirgatae]ODP39257.1 hypothetical protein BFL28_10615 [Sphingomonas turrisvirgatae]
MASVVSICNDALASIGADAIASIEERSVSAVECKRAYDGVVDDILSRHEWGFLTRRVTGAPVVTDRSSEWTYGYAKPDGATRVLRVLPKPEASYPEFGMFDLPMWDAYGPIPFVEQGGTIYANVPNAIVEYRASTAPVSDFPPLLRYAVSMELAARVAMPIKKDRAIKGDAIQMAELSLKRAIAEDENRYPRRVQQYVSEAELARRGAFG